MIHSHDPFATPESARSEVRRLRGRFAQTVTLWTAPGPAGLTVSSCLIADGEPGRVLGIVDDESTVWDGIQKAGRFAIIPLGVDHKQLADRFAGLLPAPGGLFKQGEEWAETEFGPVLGGTWAGCRLDSARSMGWGLLVEATLVTVVLGDSSSPLIHYRGSYRQLGDR